MRDYLYSLIRRYLSLFILPSDSVVEIDPMSSLLIAKFPNGKVAFRGKSGFDRQPFPKAGIVEFESITSDEYNYVVASNLLHYERDIQSLLASIYLICQSETRLILTYYSSLWRPVINLVTKLGLRKKLPEANWLSHEDIFNLLKLENFEVVQLDHKILLPVYIPLLSNFINRFLAPLPGFRIFCLVSLLVARPIKKKFLKEGLSASIIVPAKNEAGNIEEIVRRIPAMGPEDELIFVEGNSTDDTWAKIQEVHQRNKNGIRIMITQQEGMGKGDAVRKGFSIAKNDILMILDADMTVPPEDLIKFYHAINSSKGELIIGSRLVYPMEGKAMRFFNLLGNKFFAVAFSFVLGQRFKDTLCGTKVISRINYAKLASNRSYFGDFDPFGDFDLIFGAARIGLQIVEIPITYKDRTYGQTNISRWQHGAVLLYMLSFAARRIKFR
jgi:hypothetical protein